MSSQIIHFEPYEIDSSMKDSDMRSDTILSKTDPLEPLDYTRDWSKEMKSTCADILPHLIDLDMSSRSINSFDSDTSSRSITGWATNEEKESAIQETSIRLQNNVYVTERRFSRVPNNTNHASRRPPGTS
jgi:hypothetical protein